MHLKSVLPSQNYSWSFVFKKNSWTITLSVVIKAQSVWFQGESGPGSPGFIVKPGTASQLNCPFMAFMSQLRDTFSPRPSGGGNEYPQVPLLDSSTDVPGTGAL